MVSNVPAFGMDAYWVHERRLVPLVSGVAVDRIVARAEVWGDPQALKRSLLADHFARITLRSDSRTPWYSTEDDAPVGGLVVIRGSWFFKRQTREGRTGCMLYLKKSHASNSPQRCRSWVSFEHGVGASGPSAMSGKKQCVVVGYKDSVGSDGVAEIRPIAIGPLTYGVDEHSSTVTHEHFRTYPEEVEEFQGIDFSSKSPLRLLRSMAEAGPGALDDALRSKLGDRLEGELETGLPRYPLGVDDNIGTTAVMLRSIDPGRELDSQGLGNVGISRVEIARAYAGSDQVVIVATTGRIGPSVRHLLDEASFVSHARGVVPKRWLCLEGQEMAKLWE